MSYVIRLVLALCCAFGLQMVPASAEKRVALVIGNSAYHHTRTLPNPKNDAEAIAKLLRANGFADVTLKNDLDYRAMRDAVRVFGEAARAADIALIYYAGHGLEVAGENYLVPTNAKLLRDADLEYEAVTLASVLSAVGRAKRLRVVILDACRNNPLGERMSLAGGVTRSVTRGLARIEPKGDVLVAYSARAGTLAHDGVGWHSPYAEALLKHMMTPGLDIRLMFGRVRDQVLLTTHQQQEPYIYGSLSGNVIALLPSQAHDGWHSVVGRDLSFAVEMPGTPTHRSTVMGEETFQTYSLEQGPVHFFVASASTKALARRRLDAMLEGFAKQDAGAWTTVDWGQRQGYMSVDAVGLASGKEVRLLAVATNERALMLAYRGPPGSSRSPNVSRFMNSLVLYWPPVLPSAVDPKHDAPPTPEEYVAKVGGDAKIVPAGELTIDGRKVICGRRPTVLDSQLDDWSAAYPGFLILNPRKLATTSTTIKLWVHAHACGFQYRGPDPTKADCFAVQRGRRQGWLTPEGLDEVCEFIRPAPASPEHLPGPRRCEIMRKCYTGAPSDELGK